MRFVLFFCALLLAFTFAKAQNPVQKTVDSTQTAKVDTLAEPAYVNRGKLAGKKAFRRSLMFPGLGQLYNYGLIVDDVKAGRAKNNQVFNKVYTLAKLAGVYTAGTMLVLSYIDNNNYYKLFLQELQYRQANGDQPDPNSKLPQYSTSPTSSLLVAKNVFKRNREVVLISMVGLYGIAAVEAYVAARLRYFNVDETLTFKVSPSTINSNTMYGYSPVPALKLTLKL
jgi:hypothetical protein